MIGARPRQLLRRTLLALGYHLKAVEAPPGLHGKRVAAPPGNNWPLPPDEAERLFSQAPFELISLESTSHGVAGALKAKIAFPDDGRRLTIKWKVAPPGTMDSWNNNPRKELATYFVQRWFLEPQDYVVPTVAVRAVPIAAYRRLDPKATPTVDGTHCLVGTLALWLEHIAVPDVLHDRARFAMEPDYAYHLSNFNVLTYLVAHRDGRSGNILVADTGNNRRVFAVDNGISFGGFVYNFLTTNWHVIRVAAIRREVVLRLRAVDRDALSVLATLVELEVDADGVLRPVQAGAPIDPDRGVRMAPGRVQLGLTTAEIEAVAQRISSLLERVDEGALAVF